MSELLPSVRAVLETTAPRWLSLAAPLPLDLLCRPPALGEWSDVECLRHLRDAERDVFPVRVRAFLAGHRLTPYDPVAQRSGDAGESPLALAEDFARLRQQSLVLLAQVQPADLDREVIHDEYGPVQLAELLNEWAAHDLMHTVQSERALMQPFVAGSGPWRSSFAAHDVAGAA